MTLTETEELLEAMKVLADKIAKEKAGSMPLVVCLDGSNKEFFNLK